MSEPRAYRKLVEQLLADPAVSEGQMMGMPALKHGSKMFGGLFEGALVVKIGRERVAQLLNSGRARPFDPSGRGRPMKDWAQLPEPAHDWLALATEAKDSLARG
jgi:TfoX/Sxy family transcriptional regulator of competence genes